MAEASAARAREYGERGIFRRIYGWFAYWLGAPGESITGSAVLSTTGSFTVGTPTISTFSNESDTERLERELGELRKEVERLHRHYEQRFESTDQRVSELSASTNQRIEVLEQAGKESRRIALRREMRGAQLFMAGAVLTTIGAIFGIAGA
jgi:hypothetical protein